MSKKKKAGKFQTVEDVLELANGLTFLDGALDDELDDVCQTEALLAAEAIKGAVLWDQIEYLYLRGYSLDRIAEIIRENAPAFKERP